ncbi:MAG: PQQ-dependent sugar dehydrogenase [Candidatus Puniceispirillales bacterium]
MFKLYQIALMWLFKSKMLAMMLMLSIMPVRAENLVTGSAGNTLSATVIASLHHPWAMSFLDESTILVTTKPGQLWLFDRLQGQIAINGVPTVFAGGQGGLGDVIPHPDFHTNQRIYLSFIDSDDGGATRYAAVISARLTLSPTPYLTDHQMIWKQVPAKSGRGHFSYRLAFAPKESPYAGQLFITSGDRQLQSPAQRMDQGLGKIIRLNDDGSVPADNPFQTEGELARTFWSIGHRNALGLAFDANGQLWAHEMGPRDGDELNIIYKGANYGWPIVSEGEHYNGITIPSHATRPDITAPAAFWIPTIAPSGLIFYDGDIFPEWQGDAFIGGLRSQALIRVTFADNQPVEAERFRWSARVREVEQSPDGAIWVLEDGASGRLIQFTKP